MWTFLRAYGTQPFSTTPFSSLKMDHSEKHIVTTPDRPFPWQIPTPWARANENTQSPVPYFNWDILVLLAAKAPHLLPKTLQTQIRTPSWSLNQVQSRNSGVSESKRRMCLATCSVDEGWAKTRTEELDECHHFEELLFWGWVCRVKRGGCSGSEGLTPYVMSAFIILL